MSNDQCLIEDYIPSEAVSAEARREKSIRKSHISTLHLWWARAAGYGALVPAPVIKEDRKGVDESATAQCKYPRNPEAIREAQGYILQAHAERGELVAVVDIEAGRAPCSRESEPFHPDLLYYDVQCTHICLA